MSSAVLWMLKVQWNLYKILQMLSLILQFHRHNSLVANHGNSKCTDSSFVLLETWLEGEVIVFRRGFRERAINMSPTCTRQHLMNDANSHKQSHSTEQKRNNVTTTTSTRATQQAGNVFYFFISSSLWCDERASGEQEETTVRSIFQSSSSTRNGKMVSTQDKSTIIHRQKANNLMFSCVV